MEELLIDAVDLGLPRSQPADLRGDDVAFNADVARRTFAGEPGPVRDAVVLNAAAAFAAHGGFPGDLTTTLRSGIARAQETIDSGGRDRSAGPLGAGRAGRQGRRIAPAGRNRSRTRRG